MDKVNALFLHFSSEHTGPIHAFGNTCSDCDLQSQDQRVAQLLVLLRLLNESAEGLERLPEPELSEIVSSAIRLCGFVDPIEARDVIAIVLEAIEIKDPIPGAPPQKGRRWGLSDA
jgi:hypothetical protein